jgi:hypothetical protein
VAEVGVRVGVALPQNPIDTRQTPYEVVEVGVLQQTGQTRLGSFGLYTRDLFGSLNSENNLFNPHLYHLLGEIPIYKRSLWGGSHPPNSHPAAT